MLAIISDVLVATELKKAKPSLLRLRAILILHASNEGAEYSLEYEQVREALLSKPIVARHLPDFVADCVDLDDFWPFIKKIHPQWEPRREFIRTSFARVVALSEGRTPPPVEPPFKRSALAPAGGGADPHLDEEVAAALRDVSLDAEALYRQSIRDLGQEERQVFVGPAAELREVLSWVLHGLAPDDVVKAQREFKPDKSSKSGVTRAHRVSFIVRSRPDTARRAIEVLEDGLSAFASAVYSRSNASTHTPAGDRRELTKLLAHLNALLRDLLT